MNKPFTIVVLFISFLVASCERTKYADNIYEDKVINNTEKKIFYVSHTDVKSDSSYCQPNDSISLIFINQVLVDMPPIGPYSLDEGKYPEPIRSIVYNLTDTTIHNAKNISLNENELKLIKSTHKFLPRRHIHTLLIDVEFLSVFKKDYTMLQKFPEYYK